MADWQINENGKFEKINNTVILDDIDSAKIKITKTLFTQDDVLLYTEHEDAVSLPVIPCRSAIGQITDLAQDNSFLEKGSKVFIPAVRPCKNCYHCTTGKENECYDFMVAGKNVNGYLKDFTVEKISDISVLPPTVTDGDAIYTEYIALALSTIDKLNIAKGQHVAIVGASVLGSILAQLIIYYQGVPILIDNDKDKLMLAKKSGVYYTFSADSQTSNNVFEITGGRMVNKVVYVAHSGVSIETAYKLASPFASVAIVGFTYPNIKIPVPLAMSKQTSTICITNGFGNTETAINLLANKVLDLSLYALPAVKEDTAIQKIETVLSKDENIKEFNGIVINMLD